jgi:hypothetical protein
MLATDDTSWELNTTAITTTGSEFTLATTASDSGPGTGVEGAYVWDVTGLTDFPTGADVGDVGVDFNTGDVWRDE